jgi:hypothetical protein
MTAKFNAQREVQSHEGMLIRKGAISVLRTHEAPEYSEWQGRAFKGEM